MWTDLDDDNYLYQERKKLALTFSITEQHTEIFNLLLAQGERLLTDVTQLDETKKAFENFYKIFGLTLKPSENNKFDDLCEKFEGQNNEKLSDLVNNLQEKLINARILLFFTDWIVNKKLVLPTLSNKQEKLLESLASTTRKIEETPSKERDIAELLLTPRDHDTLNLRSVIRKLKLLQTTTDNPEKLEALEAFFVQTVKNRIIKLLECPVTDLDQSIPIRECTALIDSTSCIPDKYSEDKISLLKDLKTFSKKVFLSVTEVQKSNEPVPLSRYLGHQELTNTIVELINRKKIENQPDVLLKVISLSAHLRLRNTPFTVNLNEPGTVLNLPFLQPPTFDDSNKNTLYHFSDTCAVFEEIIKNKTTMQGELCEIALRSVIKDLPTIVEDFTQHCNNADISEEELIQYTISLNNLLRGCVNHTRLIPNLRRVVCDSLEAIHKGRLTYKQNKSTDCSEFEFNIDVCMSTVVTILKLAHFWQEKNKRESFPDDISPEEAIIRIKEIIKDNFVLLETLNNIKINKKLNNFSIVT